MTSKINDEAYSLTYSEYKTLKTNLAKAERKPGVKQEEIDNLKRKLTIKRYILDNLSAEGLLYSHSEDDRVYRIT